MPLVEEKWTVSQKYCLILSVDTRMLVWTSWCWCGPRDAGVYPVMLVWTSWCWCGPHDAGVDPVMLVWTPWCSCGPRDAGVDIVMLVWIPWCWCGHHDVSVDTALLVGRSQGTCLEKQLGNKYGGLSTCPEPQHPRGWSRRILKARRAWVREWDPVPPKR